MNKLPYQPYHLYRRGDIWIKDEFNYNNEENYINSNLVTTHPIIMRTKSVGDGTVPFSNVQQTDESGAPYWSLHTDQESEVDLQINYETLPKLKDKLAQFFEFKFDAGVFGPGYLYAYVSKHIERLVDPPQEPVIPDIANGGTNVYGNNIDLINARLIFGEIGFNYIYSDDPSFVMPTFTNKDIVLGGVGATGGIPDVELNGAVRLWGQTRFDTQKAVQDYNNLHNTYTRIGSYFYKMNIDINNLIQKFYGPTSWQISNYHRLCVDDWIQFYYNCGLRTDPVPSCEIDNLVIYPYYDLDCEIAILPPLKSETQPKKLEVLRGLNAFQTTANISCSTDLVLRFYSADSHTDFIQNCDKPHVLCDEKGVPYRGVLDLGEPIYYGSGLYEQKVKFYSSNKLGVGWI